MTSFEVKVLQEGQYPSQLLQLLGSGSLYAVGSLGLLEQPCIGLCGSRDASPSALEWAYEFGREAARQGVVVVSGYARGVDRQAHKGAMEAGGGTIAVLPEGIQHFRVVGELRALVNLDSNFLAVSTFEPQAVWKAWRAMNRNKVIVGLSAGLFVIEARERGGTINAAYECIRQHKGLWAVAYDDQLPGREGNRRLIARSAIPLKHMDDLAPALEEAMARPPAEVRQLVLNVTGLEKDAEKEATL